MRLLVFLKEIVLYMILLTMQDVFFDDESAEGVMSSLRLGEEHDRLVFLVSDVNSFLTTISILFTISNNIICFSWCLHVYVEGIQMTPYFCFSG